MKEINSNDLDFYDSNGYVIVKNAILEQYIDDLMEFIASVIKMEAERLGMKDDYTTEQLLHSVLGNIKKKNRDSSSWIYQTINNSNIFKKFIYNLELDQIIKKLLHMGDLNHLATVNPALRIDMPFDNDNIRDWHQDSHYFLDNEKGSDALVTWICLGDAYKENGSIFVCPKSHKEGRLNSKHSTGSSGVSEQFVTDNDIVNKYEKIIVEAKKGDVVLFNMDLIHKSGNNISKFIRYTTQLRYSNLGKLDYTPPQTSINYRKYNRPFVK
jgi:ectoine hydroxylase-related dioxygenase (phytanoyl-CoA dioxygenase family)